MKNTCDFSGFTFTGTDGKTYGYDKNGAPCTTSGISTTNISDVIADKWGNIANKPILEISTTPSQPLIQNNINTNPSYTPNIGFQPNISISQPNIPIVNTTPLNELPRIATEKEFTATCHGSIVVNSIIDHAITRNSQGYGSNALASLKTFNLSHNYLGDGEIKKLNDGLYGYTLNLQIFNFCNNKMGAVGLDHLIKGSIGIDHLQKGGNDIHNMMQGILTLPSTSIVCLNLANNNIGDIGADILGHALANGKLPATKYIDISGNGITKDGDTKIVQALKEPKTPDVVVVTKQLTDSLKMITGTKEEKIAIFKDLLRQGAEKGTSDKAIVADGNMYNKIKLGAKQLFGFSKCQWNPEEIVQSYAEDKIFAKLPKTLGKFLGNTLNIQSIVSCYLEASNDAWTSDIGQAVLKDQLCVMGETEFCNDQ